MTRLRALTLGLLLAMVLASIALPGRLGGSFALLSETESLTGGVSSGQWLARITVTKAVEGEQEFTFDTGATPGCDEDTTIGNGESFSCTFNATGDTSYTIAETAVDGWAAPSIACTPEGAVTVPPASGDPYTISFDLDPGDDVTCTFTNVLAIGDITIAKTATGGSGSATFGFTTTIPGCEDASITVAADDSESRDCGDQPAGSYVIAEDALEGWTLTAIACSGEGSSFFYGSPSSQTHTTFQAGDTAVQVTLGAGSSVTCNFTNARDTGSVEVVKQADAPGTFAFDLSAITAAGGTCTGTSITVSEGSEPPLQGSITCEDVPTGSYTIAEADPGSAWSFAGVDCGDGENESRSVTLTVTRGETTTCTFVNQVVPLGTRFIQSSTPAPEGCGVEGATNLALATATAAPETLTEAGPAGSIDDVYFTFTSDPVHLSTWAAGNYVVELDVAAQGGQVREYRVQVLRVSGSCGSPTEIGISTYQSGSGPKTFVVAGSASSGSTSDRLQVRVLVNVGPGTPPVDTPKELDLRVNTISSEVITP